MAINLTDNQFYTGLTNLALYIAMYATNKTSKSKGLIDTFTTEPIDYGDTKIFRSLPFPEVSDYSDTTSLLGNHTPSFTPRGSSTPVNVYEETLKIDKFKVIKNSYNLRQLELAVKNDYGMSDFVAIVLGNVEAAKIDYLYKEVINTLYDGSAYYNIVPIELVDMTNITTPTEIIAAEKINQKRIALRMQKVIDAMTTFSTSFNQPGLKQAVDMADLRLVVFQPYKNQAVVDLFAELLNSKYISENFPRPELVTIPEARAAEATNYDSSFIAVICHKAFIQLFYKLVYMGEFFDASTLRINNFLHFWYKVGKVAQLPNCIIKVKTE